MGNGIGGRIVGGRDADEGEYPWQVSWRRVEGDGAYHSCGGSVLNEDFVLTAGPQSKYNREFLSPISNGFSFLGSKAHSRFGHYFCSNLYGRAPRGPRGVKKSNFFYK